jgi:hypothetical protein
MVAEVTGREKSLAHNETAARAINDKIEERVLLFAGEEPSFGILCECDRADCEQRITVTAAEYERIRADPDLFFVLPGHEDNRIEQVISQEGTQYLIVKKTGDAKQIADRE